MSESLFPNLLLAGGLLQNKYDDPTFQELLRNLLIRQQELIKEQLKNSANQNAPTKTTGDHLNNGKQSDSRNLMHMSMLQHVSAKILKLKILTVNTKNCIIFGCAEL